MGFVCGIGQILAGGAIMASGVAFEIATFGGYTFALGFHEAAGFSLMTMGCAMATYHAQDMKVPNIAWKTINIKKTNSNHYPAESPEDGSYIIIKNDPGAPKSNVDQNKQADDAKKEIEKKLGRKLASREHDQFHDHVTGQGYGYHELVEEGYWLFDGS